MYNDFLHIGKFTIHGYGVMIAIGFLVAIFVSTFRAKKKGLDPEVVIDLALISVVGGFVGAKILFVIVDFKEMLTAPLTVLGSGGFVVYGGIILATLLIFLYCKKKKVKFFEYMDLIVPQIPIAQGFGRLGCFCAGCCYGAETTSPLGVVFPQGSLAPAGVKLWPVQIFSAAGDFLIFAILLLYSKKSKKPGNVSCMYFILYGIGRFIIEYFRADERGSVSIFSTSQFISLFIVAAGVILFVYNCVRKKQTTDVEAIEEEAADKEEE